MNAILEELADEAEDTLGERTLGDIREAIVGRSGPESTLRKALSRWAKADPRPLVLLIDEIDKLVGKSLMAALLQLRVGYKNRPLGFPQSVVLCGVRDLKDYRLSPNEADTGGSSFNIKYESLRLGDFSQDDVQALLAQHTKETGQAYEPEAVEIIWERTQGQPWLVNALAAEICKLRKADDARSGAISVSEVREAEEVLILRRDTHLDQLIDRLKEDRVRRVIEPMLVGGNIRSVPDEDRQYVKDLGLVAPEGPLRIANPIYKEVIPRELTREIQEDMEVDPKKYMNADGGLNVRLLLGDFQKFFRRNSGHWPVCHNYDEAGAQLLLQAYIQIVINSRGRIDREVGLGRRRVDLMLFWREDKEEARIVIECKTRKIGQLEQTLREGLPQTADYMDIGATGEGHLVIFDRSEKRSWEEKIYHREETHEDKTIEVWGV